MSRPETTEHHSREHADELERQLIRLADGELPPDERQRVLRHIDALPGGWRRCALIFLENQAFAEDFPAALEPPSPPATTPATPTAPPARWRWLPWTTAVAASWLAMFALGGQWHSRFQSAPNRDTRPVGLPPAVERLLVRDQWESGVQKDRRSASASDPLPAPSGFSAERMPSVELWPTEEALPRDLLELFRSQGLEPKVLDSYLPVQLNDGRRIIIPKSQRERAKPPR
jgi:hypothetical protein